MALRSKQENLVLKARGNVEATEQEGSLLSDLREVQCLICCLLHQMFIADPNIAKLVHFQVTRRERADARCTPDVCCFFPLTTRRRADMQSQKPKRGFSLGSIHLPTLRC